MADIYCDYTSGNDTTGTGASGTPYKTLQKCVDVANGADTIYVANTSAQVIASGGITFNTGFGGVQNANAAVRPLVIKPWNNGGALTIAHPVLGNLMAFHVAASSVSSGQDLWNTASQPTYVYIYRMWITALVGQGQCGGNWKFLQCGGNAASLASGKSLLALGGANTGGSIEECYVTNVPTGAFGLLISTNAVSGMIIGSYISGVDAGGSGISGVAINNIIKGVAGTGIKNADSVTARFNTIVGDGSTASAIGISILQDGNGSITDNLIAGFAGAGAAGIKASSPYKVARLGNNSFWNNTANISGTITKLLEDLTGSDKIEIADPFTNAAGGDYSLRRAALSRQASVPLFTGSSTTQKLNIGAVQGGSGGGGGVHFS